MVDFEFSPSLNEDIRTRTIQVLKEKGEYFDTLKVKINGGDYVKYDNAPNGKRIIYKSNPNKLFFFSKGSDIVLVTSGESYEPAKINLPEPKVDIDESLVKVGEYECKRISLVWDGIGVEDYYYADSVLPMDIKYFEKHNYEYLNEILSYTKHYPVKMVKTSNGLITISMELIDVSSKSSDPIEVPELKKASKKDSELVNQLTGYDVMIIKK